jgi:hypothetical protein
MNTTGMSFANMYWGCVDQQLEDSSAKVWFELPQQLIPKRAEFLTHSGTALKFRKYFHFNLKINEAVHSVN